MHTYLALFGVDSTICLCYNKFVNDAGNVAGDW